MVDTSSRERSTGKTRDMQVCFRDPHNPWQRGIDENTNGLLHQCFPKGIDLSSCSQYYLDAVAD